MSQRTSKIQDLKKKTMFINLHLKEEKSRFNALLS